MAEYILGLLTFLASVFAAYMMYRTAWVPRGETREQAREREANTESIEVATLEKIIAQLRLRVNELETQNQKWKDNDAARDALMQKREIEAHEARERIRKDLVSFQAAYAQAVHTLQKHNLPVPEINGRDTPPKLPAVKP